MDEYDITNTNDYASYSGADTSIGGGGDPSDYNVVYDSTSTDYDPSADNWGAWDEATNNYLKENYPELAGEDPGVMSKVGTA